MPHRVERTIRDRLAWFVVVAVFFPLTIFLAWSLSHERTMRQESEFQATLWLAVVDQTHSGVIVVNADTGEIVSWNKGAEKLLGWQASEVHGNSLLFLLPEEYREQHVKHLVDPSVRAKLDQSVLQMTCWLHTKNGPDVQVAITVRGIQDISAQRYRFVLTFDRVEQIVPLLMPGRPNTENPTVSPHDFPIPQHVREKR